MYCNGCGCCLQGLGATRCPECDRVFDPANKQTYRTTHLLRGCSLRLVILLSVLLLILTSAAITAEFKMIPILESRDTALPASQELFARHPLRYVAVAWIAGQCAIVALLFCRSFYSRMATIFILYVALKILVWCIITMMMSYEERVGPITVIQPHGTLRLASIP